MKKCLMFIVFVLIILVSSCSMHESTLSDDAVDGVAFDYFTTYEIDDKNYDVFLPIEINKTLYYSNKIGNIKSSSKEWTINFMHEAVYHGDESLETKEVWNQLYTNLLASKDVLSEKCGFEVMLFDPYTSVELEYVLHNDSGEEASYVMFYTYLPIRLVNKSTKKTTTVGIPVNVDVLLKIGDMVENPFNDEMMSWEDFLAI